MFGCLERIRTTKEGNFVQWPSTAQCNYNFFLPKQKFFCCEFEVEMRYTKTFVIDSGEAKQQSVQRPTKHRDDLFRKRM